jgi:hypothetical protein
MAKKIESFDFSSSSTRRYDWNTWLNGDIWVVEKADYAPAKPETFTMIARARAKQRDMKVRLNVNKESGEITLQAYMPEAFEAEANGEANGETHPEANGKPARKRRSRKGRKGQQAQAEPEQQDTQADTQASPELPPS